MSRCWIALLLGAAAACGSGDGSAGEGATSAGAGARETPSPEEMRGDPLEALSSRGTFLARVTPLVASIPMNEAFGVSLTLTDPETGEVFSDYDEVSIDARMPAHKHGMLRDVDLNPQPDGTLRADGLLMHMYGHWEIHVDVMRGGRFERAQIDVRLQY